VSHVSLPATLLVKLSNSIAVLAFNYSTKSNKLLVNCVVVNNNNNNNKKFQASISN
jgi:hypothetical protein